MRMRVGIRSDFYSDIGSFGESSTRLTDGRSVGQAVQMLFSRRVEPRTRILLPGLLSYTNFAFDMKANC
jgi:hypothetical protein